MNKLYPYFFLAVALGLFSPGAAATKLTVNQGPDSCVFQLAADSTVVIDPATGDISATVTNIESLLSGVCTSVTSISVQQGNDSCEFDISPAGASVNKASGSLSAGTSNLDSLLSGACMTVNSVTVQQGDHSCQFDISPGGTAINAGAGHISLTSTNLEECAGAPDPDPPVISDFFRDPSTVESGDTVTFGWTSAQATGCSATGNLPGWSGTKPIQGPQTITVNAGPGTYSAGLQCTNGAGDTVTAGPLPVTVSSDGTKNCPDFPPPANLTRATNGRQLTGTTSFCSNCGSFWKDMFEQFFGRGNEAWYYQEPGRYHALEFNSGPLPSAGQTGYVDFTEPHNFQVGQSVRNGRRILTISECPGDFHANALPQGCKRVDTGNGSIRWEGSANQHAFDCPLEPNTRYYLNIVHTTATLGDPNPAWTCTGNDLGGGLRGCGAMMIPRGSYGSGQ